VEVGAGAGVSSEEDVENVVIVGSGPAGYTAAIYAARASLKPVLFEGLKRGGTPGGQLMTTTEVENFPGFPEGISGPELMDRMKAQAARWGAELVTEDVDEVDFSSRPFVLRSAEREVRAHSVIFATGATALRLGIPSEHEFWSRGISACAICDGAAPQFRGQHLAVVGGGDTATEEAVYLTKYGSHVHLLVRGDQMRASKTMQERALNHERVTVHYGVTIDDAYADAKKQMAGVRLRHKDGGVSELPVRGLFYGIGHAPNSDLLQGAVDLDPSGYVRVVPGTVETNVPGVFAAGDLQDHEFRQAITAAGTGCMAAILTERYLVANNLMVDMSKRTLAGAVEAQAQAQAAEAEGAKAAAEGEVDPAELYDPSQARHKGQYALRKLYHESDRLMIVMYSSPSCGPCRTMKPMLSKVLEEYPEDAIHYVEIDIAEDQEIAEAAGITGTPTLQLFKNKDRLAVHKGVKMKNDMRKMIEAAGIEKKAA